MEQYNPSQNLTSNPTPDNKKNLLLWFLVAFAALSVVFFSAYFVKKIVEKKQTEKQSQLTPIILQSDQNLPDFANTDANPESTREISGKIRSINEKAVYIELKDGKGFATNINPNTPVSVQGANKASSLVDLKTGQNITVKVNSKDDAIQILINKQ